MNEKTSDIVPISVGARVFYLEKAELAFCCACTADTSYVVGRFPACVNQSCYDVVAEKAVDDYNKALARRFSS